MLLTNTKNMEACAFMSTRIHVIVSCFKTILNVVQEFADHTHIDALHTTLSIDINQLIYILSRGLY